MERVTRRAFTQDLLGSLLTYALASSLAKAGALNRPSDQIVRPWVLEMEHATKAMTAHETTQRRWQESIQELLARIDLSDLLQAIDFDALVRRVRFRESHESVLEIDLAKRERLKTELSFASFFYAMKRGVAIVPHGHQNMATMHMVLAGEARALHYDRVASDREYVIIKPLSDVIAKRGDASTVSDESSNIHWFKTVSDTVFMFNIGVFGINPQNPITGREYVDPLRGEKTDNGLIRARRMTNDEAYRVYGKS